MKTPQVNELHHFIVFVINQKQYAVSLYSVERVIRAVEVTSLAEAPAVVQGLINMERKIIPVMNLRCRFNLPRREVQPEDKLIIVNTGERIVALWVDSVEEILELPASDVVPSNDILPCIEEFAGTIIRDNGLTLIYDLERLLSLEEEAELADALSGQE